MDPKIYKKTLPDDPTEADFVYWKRMLSIYITKAQVPDDDKLEVLFVLCGAKTFPLIEECTSYDAAIAALEAKFQKQSTAIMMRHKLRARKQLPTETIETFMADLRNLSKKCSTKALTAEQHRELLISDAFVAGLHSSTIRQRLLESADDSLEKLYSTALTMEIAIEDTKVFATPSESPQPIYAAAAKYHSKSNCVWCGGTKHERSTCPARSSTCNKCEKKGHWGSVCLNERFKRRNKSAAALEDTSEPDPTISTILAAIDDSKGLIDTCISNIQTKALIDTGSDLSFINLDFARQHDIPFSKVSNKSITLADKSTCKVSGQFQGTITILDKTYEANLFVVSSLVTPLIIGLDILRQHSELTLIIGGPKEPATFCLTLSTMKQTTYRLMPGVDTDRLKPIATSSRRNPKHTTFINEEISKLLNKGIIQVSQSPWRAQCLVAENGKKSRLVIDFSNTINIHTPLDSYPSARIDDILNQVASNQVFSKIDLASAYHQVPLDPRDYKLTAFEACGQLYEFTKLPFGCCNAVAIFQRTMDEFIKNNKLQKTYAYMDDIIIAGSTQNEHDTNLAAFKSAAESSGIEMNNEKCKFSQISLQFLGHIVGGGILKPDPERFKALLDYPIPTTLKQLNSLIGLFAYYAKWILNCTELTLPLTKSCDTIVMENQ